MTIEPHGGTLVCRAVNGAQSEELALQAADMPQVTLNSRDLSDLEMLATGGLSPLEGFMDGATYSSVVDSMRLTNGLPWAIPVTLAVERDEAAKCEPGQQVALHDADGTLMAVMDLQDFSTFQACFNGPNRPPVFVGCDVLDFDTDGDVDLVDFGAFQGCFNGPNRPPKCG